MLRCAARGELSSMSTEFLPLISKAPALKSVELQRYLAGLALNKGWAGHMTTGEKPRKSLKLFFTSLTALSSKRLEQSSKN